MKLEFMILGITLLLSILQINEIHCQTECINTALGENYVGKSTRSNCINWSTAPQNLNYKDDSQFPDITVVRAKNYCRNPKRGDGVLDPKGPFCYITSTASPNYEYCNLPSCKSLGICRETYLGETYKGKVDKTYTGKTCQRWDAQSPHTHTFTAVNWPTRYGETIAQASNFCRNPNNSPVGPWCYTTDSSIVWEPCITSLCTTTLECVNGTSPYNFRSLAQTDQFLRTCARWNNVPITYYDTTAKLPTIFANATTGSVKPPLNPALLIDPTFAQNENYCRNPDNDPKGAWCYVQDGTNFNKQYCKTPCTGIWACLYDRIGNYYQGTVDITESGDACDSWTNHATITAGQLPDETVADAKNYCRNPDNNPGGPWCFVASATKKFGFCSLPTCLQTPPIPPFVPTNVSSICQNTTIGTEYTGKTALAIGGKICLSWTTTSIDNPYFNRPRLFNVATMAEVGNYCRNPNKLLTGPWCYTAGGVVTKCNVELCTKPPSGPRVNCRTTLEATKYNGTVNVTADNRPCLRWDSITPLGYSNADFVDGNLRYAENYCRGIAKNTAIVGPFCFALNPTSGKADQVPCVVKLCASSNCRTTVEGYEYTGTKSTTVTGKTCLAWKTTKDLNYDLLPDESLDAASNYCRNPSKDNVKNGPFCYVTASETESCGINYCQNQCRKTQTGFEYNGIVNRVGQLKCFKWSAASNINYRDATKLQATTLAEASNYCRNPNNDAKGPWCYTAANPLVETYCRLPACTPNSNCQYPGSGWTYNGVINKTKSGKTCGDWKDYETNKAMVEGFGLTWTATFQKSLLPDRPEVDIKNYCRAAGTADPLNEKPWCILTVDDLMTVLPGGQPYELCDVTTCNLTTTTMSTSTTTQSTTTVTTTAPTTVTTTAPTTVTTIVTTAPLTTVAPPVTTTRNEHCITPENAFLYNGTMNVTSNGRACANWNTMNMAAISHLKGPSYAKTRFPDNSVAEASNYCRTPTTDPNYMRQPWCFLSPADAAKANTGNNFEFCSMPTCNTTDSSPVGQAFAVIGMNITLTFALYTLGLSGVTLLELFEVAGDNNEAATPNEQQNADCIENEHEIVTPATQQLVQSQGPGQNIMGVNEIQPQLIQPNQANPNFQAAHGFNIIGQGQDTINPTQIQQSFTKANNVDLLNGTGRYQRFGQADAIAGQEVNNMVQFNQLNAANGGGQLEIVPQSKIVGYGKETNHMIQLKQLNAANGGGKLEIVPQNKIVGYGKETNHMIQLKQLNAANGGGKLEIVPQNKIVGYGKEEVHYGQGEDISLENSEQAFKGRSENMLPDGSKIIGYQKEESFYGYYSMKMGSDYEDSKLPKISAAEYEEAQNEERRQQTFRDFEEARLMTKGTAEENIAFLKKAIAEEEHKESISQYKSFKLEDFKRRLANYERQELEKAQKAERLKELELKKASGGNEIEEMEEISKRVEIKEEAGYKSGHNHKYHHHGNRGGQRGNRRTNSRDNDTKWRKVDAEVRYYDLITPTGGGEEYVVKAEVHGNNARGGNEILNGGSLGQARSKSAYSGQRARSATRSRVETQQGPRQYNKGQITSTSNGSGGRTSRYSTSQAQGNRERSNQSGSRSRGTVNRTSSEVRHSSYSGNNSSRPTTTTQNNVSNNNGEEPFVSILDDWRPFS